MLGRHVVARLQRLPDVEVLAPTRAELDVRDMDGVRRALRDGAPEAVIHLAATVGGIAANVAEPARFLADNAAMSVAVVDGAWAEGVRTLINVGSSCLYPRHFERPIREEDLLAGELEPTNEGYALGKLVALKLAAYRDRDPERHFKTLMPCNLYGPFEHADPARAHLVLAALMKLEQARQAGAASVEIWGDGSVRREFLFVDDFAAFVVRAALDPAPLPSLLNVGFGADFAVNEYYERAREVVGATAVRFEHALDKPVGMKRKLMDSSRARALGWNPTTSLAEGMRATLAYLRARTEPSHRQDVAP
jgi:GDP-L-fucose synthase